MVENSLSDWPHELICSIKKGPLAVFLGAGVSIDSPSNLPDGNRLKSDIFNAITSTGTFSESLMSQARDAIHRYRPELFLHLLDEWRGIEWRPLLDFMLEAEPNTNHNIVAHLTHKKQLQYILTTNYDTLIEDAFKKYDLPVNLCFRDEHFDNSSKGGDIPRILKLHGSLLNNSGVLSIDTILGSMKEVTSRLSQNKEELLRYVMKNYVMIFLGYSGLDEFDIYPILMDSEAKQMIWVSHTGIGHPTRILSCEDIRSQDKHDHIDALIMRNRSSFRIGCFTPLFLSHVSELTTGLNFKIEPSNPVVYRKPKMASISRHPYQLIGLLLQFGRKWKSAAEAYEHSLPLTIKNFRHHCYIVPEIHRGIGVCNKELGNFTCARDNFNIALNHLELTLSALNSSSATSEYQHHFRMISQTCEDIGLTLLAEEDYDRAISWITKAISWTKRMVLPKQSEFLARNYGNLGIAHKNRGKDQKDYEDAYYYLSAGVVGEQACGNIFGQAIYSYHLSKLFICLLRWSDAMNASVNCLILSHYLGELFPKGMIVGMMGAVVCCLCALVEDRNGAENLLKESRYLGQEDVDRCISLYIKAQSKGYVFYKKNNEEIGPLREIFGLVSEEYLDDIKGKRFGRIVKSIRHQE